MGQFSWIYSDTHKQLIDNKLADTYLLVPPEFRDKYGEAIYEPCYNGYGMFGRHDIYELIAEWNKSDIPQILEKAQEGGWKCSVSRWEIEQLMAFFHGEKIKCELRWLGIIMACYNEDNASLKYPIKVTTKPMSYNEVGPSLTDPKQGWED